MLDPMVSSPAQCASCRVPEGDLPASVLFLRLLQFSSSPEMAPSAHAPGNSSLSLCQCLLPPFGVISPATSGFTISTVHSSFSQLRAGSLNEGVRSLCVSPLATKKLCAARLEPGLSLWGLHAQHFSPASRSSPASPGSPGQSFAEFKGIPVSLVLDLQFRGDFIHPVELV
jgi:hypothetical protein